MTIFGSHLYMLFLDKKTGSGTMVKRNSHPHLRLVVVRGETLEDPRRYAQSTSGLVCSTGTSPPLSRSSEIASDSRIRSFVDRTLRKYPSEVSQRLANEMRSGTGSPSRNVRSNEYVGVAIAHIVPDGTSRSIPRDKIPNGMTPYNRPMDKGELRRLNFVRILHEKYGGRPSVCHAATGISENVISQLKNGHKRVIREQAGAAYEKKMKLEPGELERPINPENASKISVQRIWPLSVAVETFESLSPKMQQEIDEAFTRMVMGAQSQDLLRKQEAKKRG